ncbi:MAG: CoA ester lyase [Stappiaceae bacterium]
MTTEITMSTLSNRPRRSVLYMPGSNARVLEKAKSLNADSLILDLEDAVAPEKKSEARDLVCRAVKGGGYGHRELILRINGLDTPWGEEDLAAAMAAQPNAILVPKIFNPADVMRIAETINAGGVPLTTELWIMMETPLAMLNAGAIAEIAKDPDARLSCMVMGTNDLAKDTKAALTAGRAPMVPWLMTCIAAARAFGLNIIDGVYNDFADLQGFADECRQGREMGMDGKTLIHPKQIDPCNEAFSPNHEQVSMARKIMAAFELPENVGKGAIQLEGKMVERLHCDMAAQLVAVAEAIEARDA